MNKPQNVAGDWMALFDELHRHPELSGKEYGTRDRLIPWIRPFGFRIKTYQKHAGFLAELGSGRPVVAIRADMDALLQHVDGVLRPNHSCGHDAHMAMVCGAGRILSEQTLPRGTIRLLFQPSEETARGSSLMIDEGCIDDVSYLFGIHLRPERELPNGFAAAAISHGAGAFFDGEISGEDAHGARPHLGQNAIEVGAALVQACATMHLNPMHPHSVKLTRFHAQSQAPNIIPGCATFTVDLRAQTNEMMTALQAELIRRTASIANGFGVEIELNRISSTPAAELRPEAQRVLARAIELELGSEALLPTAITTGGDDFHVYSVRRPDLNATMLALGCGLQPGLHHPKMTFDRSAIDRGVRVLARTAILALERASTSS